MILHQAQNEIFGERLKTLRKKRFRTQEVFAEAMDVSVNSVKKWESGRVLPETEHLLQISELLDCDLDYLVGRIDCKTHSVQDISGHTGLSEKAIGILHEWNRLPGGMLLVWTLSALIEQKNHFGAVLSCAWNYFHPPVTAKANSENIIVIDTGHTIPSAQESSLFMSSNNLVNCIKEAGKKYQK